MFSSYKAKSLHKLDELLVETANTVYHELNRLQNGGSHHGEMELADRC